MTKISAFENYTKLSFFFFIHFHQISFKCVQNLFKFVQNLLFKKDKEDIPVKTYLYLKSYMLIQSMKGPVSLSIELGQDRQIFFSCIQQTLINLPYIQITARP